MMSKFSLSEGKPGRRSAFVRSFCWCWTSAQHQDAKTLAAMHLFTSVYVDQHCTCVAWSMRFTLT